MKKLFFPHILSNSSPSPTVKFKPAGQGSDFVFPLSNKKKKKNLYHTLYLRLGI